MTAPRLEPLDEATWETTRSALPGSTVFHSWWFLEMAAAALGVRFHPLGLVNNGSLVGLAPMLERRRGPVTTLNWVPFPYAGPITTPETFGAMFSLLDRFARRHRAAVVQLSFAREDPDLRSALADRHFSVMVDTTFVVPTAGATKEELLARMRQNGRRDLRKAEAGGLRVRDSTSSEVLHDLPRLLEQIPQTGWPIRRTAEAAWAMLGANRTDRARLRSVVDAEERLQAVTITLLDGPRAYLWLGAAARHDRVDAHAPIYWDAFCDAVDRGLDFVDLVGTPSPSIGAYKRKFGALEQSFLVARRFRIPAYEHLQHLYGRQRTNRA